MRHAQIILISLFACTSPALTASQSRVTTYPVTGTSAKAIYDSIKASSPRVARNATFAFTTPFTKTVSATRKSKTACSYARFRTSSYFIYTLPRLATKKAVSATLAAKWSSFAAYLKTHEEGHGSIWRSCLAEYDAESLKLSAKTCDGLDKAREQLFTKIKKRCLQKDEAYDFVFRKEVLKQPFVAEALGKN